MVKQFDGYYIEPNIHHNGKLVLGESIGDLAGVKIAYLAFQNAQTRPSRRPQRLTDSRQTSSSSLPGDNFVVTRRVPRRSD